MDDQREIHGHRVIALVDHRLGEVEGGDARVLEEAVIEQHLVHAGALAEGQAHQVLQANADIVRVQHRIFGRQTQPVRAVAQHVGQRPDEHAHLAVEGRHAAKRLLAILEAGFRFHQFQPAFRLADEGQRRERGKTARQNHRTGARSAAAMRGGEGLVQVDVHRIDAQIPRPRLADDGVEVGAVAVEIGIGGVDGRGNLHDVPLEQPAGVRVGQHDGGNVAVILRNRLLHRGQIHRAVVLGVDGDDLEAEQRSGGRVGAMGTFRHQHDLRITARSDMRGLDCHHAALLAMGTGLRAHGDGGGAGQLHQPVTQLGDEFHGALDGRQRLQRVNVAKARHARHLLVKARVVLHGAGAERIKPGIDGVIVARQAHVMAHRLRLGEARQADLRRAGVGAQLRLESLRLIQINARHIEAADLEQQRLFHVERTVAGEGLGPECRARIARSGRASLSVHAHASTSLSAAAKAARSSSVLISVEATTRRFARSLLRGSSRDTGTPARMPRSASASTT